MTGSTPGTPVSAQAEPASRFSPANVLIGVILLAVGIIWLLQSSGVVDVSWYVVTAAVLVVIGIGLVIGSVSGEQSGLISIGVILTVLLMLSSWADVSFSGGIGDRTITPASIEELESSYGVIAGTLRLDLSNIDFPEGETRVEAAVTAGRIHLIVPEDVAVSVEWSVLAGNVEVLGQEHEGALLDDSEATPGFADAGQRLVLDLQVLAGQIEVHQ